MASSRMIVFSAVALTLVILVLLDQPTGTEAGYGKHGGHGKAGGTACIVKGSYCSCHYCKCEKGHIHCGHKHGYGKHNCVLLTNLKISV